MSTAPQQILRIRRDYNAWVANETLEDYSLRYTPRSFRKWSEFRVANTAFGAVSFLALEAIGGTIALKYGFANALWAILLVGLITFLTGLPISVYAARHGLDMDLLTRGAGFGYLGSTITSLIYASFTFIFFALEAAIMALALQMVTGLPIAWCYAISAIVVIPLVAYGITLISRLQLWSQPLWLFLFALPFLFIAFRNPESFATLANLSGSESGSASFDPLMFGMAATVAFALVVQIGEQVDYLRFLPEKTPENAWRWWSAVVIAGPGWIVPGMLKMLAGAFLAHLAMLHGVAAEEAVQPTEMYRVAFEQVFGPSGWAIAATVIFVVVSQMKINLTNAYAGSLAWSNFFARLTHSHPGRVVWLVFNVAIALLLMTLGVFGALERVLGLYANVAIAWVGALVADLVVNKPLGLSPRHIEFKRANLFDLNPVGLGSMSLAAAIAIVAYTGALGPFAEAFSPLIALGTSLVTAPAIAWLTRGRYYLARSPSNAWEPGRLVRCAVCENSFESEDIASCPAYGAPICSLCCTLESRCRDRCKTRSRASEQALDAVAAILPSPLSGRFNVRLGHYLVVFASLSTMLALVLGVVYFQETLVTGSEALRLPFVKAYALLELIIAVCSWWVVLASESRRMAEDESARQNQLLRREVDAHRRTDAALQAAKDLAESASRAKTRYVAGITHELRTPLNSILGYAQILLKNPQIAGAQHEAVFTIQRSGEHLHALVDGLLDLARIEAGRLRLDNGPVPLRELLDDVVRMVEPQARAKGLAFDFETAGRVPALVHTDAKRLRQILLNLLGNAVRFTRSGRVLLRVDARRAVLSFEVADTGIGIAPQDLERIFLPFERGSAGRRTAEPGTGLGLTITNLLTELMGGELTVRSELGKGSVFAVRIYLRELAASGPGSLPQPPRHRPVIGYEGPRRALLVVDDQPIQRQMIAGMLAPLGFTIRESASARECLESVRESRPDAVLLDISMDDLDGWQAARMLREDGFEDLPIIMVSADVFENRPENLEAVGAQAFVAKPVIESELLEALGRHLQLEWITEFPLETPAVTHPALDAAAFAVPAEALAGLRRFALSGQPRALRERLGELARERPDLAPLCEQWRRLADEFDFEALNEQLRKCNDS
ncbi:ATP-binding protein [Burkholderiaceae bacterium FT117]|uniref:hybrid sensor histidine kinase/response regulator n=1 Tax=Zeimonas sediminis TaxID=2944268 RepID=UPI002342F838|nr:ATP-binding protein [Zeimonas sediminis]MCM5571874.1 ATP-binding protein [Zeimonas sediminis]